MWIFYLPGRTREKRRRKIYMPGNGPAIRRMASQTKKPAWPDCIIYLFIYYCIGSACSHSLFLNLALKSRWLLFFTQTFLVCNHSTAERRQKMQKRMKAFSSPSPSHCKTKKHTSAFFHRIPSSFFTMQSPTHMWLRRWLTYLSISGPQHHIS